MSLIERLELGSELSLTN